MKRKKLAMASNLSNQANIHNSEKALLSQFNYFVLLGLEYLERNIKKIDQIPLAIRINRSGELEINGLNEDSLKNMHIHTDKKVTRDSEQTSS